MPLDSYRQKRNFRRTAEPQGTTATDIGNLFVIQHHAARRDHYDLRLELDGVLKSWAVPKGPCLDPNEKRLAIHVEDHPVDYGDFEGVIPKGEYGAGPVLVWDRGRWRPQGDPRRALTNGHLSFTLQGQKLQGKWHLVRLPPAEQEQSKEAWLLLKHDDRAAKSLPEGEIVESSPLSVLSGLSLDEIAQGKSPAHATLPNVGFQLARSRERPPAGEDWLHELKYDGYRVMVFREGAAVRMVVRSGQDWTAKFTRLATALLQLPAWQFILDGEVVFLREDGVSDFSLLQDALSRDDLSRLYYVAFDLLWRDEKDLREVPLVARKQQLAALLQEAPAAVRYGDHVEAQAEAFYEAAKKMGVEGMVSKRTTSPYAEHRSSNWLKIKFVRREEFVVGGYTAARGEKHGLGALLVGAYDGNGNLVYYGKVGTGFDAQTAQALLATLKDLHQVDSPFERGPGIESAMPVQFVRPSLVIDVGFVGFTGNRLLRAAAFKGVRKDKLPHQVEKPNDASALAPRPFNRRPFGIVITHPDKVMYPDLGLRKKDIIVYYESVAEAMLPYVVHRPLTLYRCPDGLLGECFFQKHVQEGLPSEVKAMAAKPGEPTRVMVDSPAGIIALAQMGALEIHVGGACPRNAHQPCHLVFDLDPDPQLPWRLVLEGAFTVRDLLLARGLTSFVRASGGKGLHVVVPILQGPSWREVANFCGELVGSLAREAPQRYVASAAKDKRKHKIYVDHLRNRASATAIASYSLRARPEASIAMPLRWEELVSLQGPAAVTLENVYDRISSRDPWIGFFAIAQRLPQNTSG